MPTMKDVALRAGVSIKTVSNVVNGAPHVRDETRERVLAVIERIGYQVNASARNLRKGRKGLVGLVVPWLSRPYFAELASAFMEVAEERGLVVVIEQTGGDRARELDVLHGPRRSITDGLVFSPQALSQEDEPEIPDQAPLVLLGERVFSPRVDHVTMRNVQAARAVVAYLLRRGRKRIALVGAHADDPDGPWALRTQGYLDGLAGAGVAAVPELIAEAQQWSLADGAAAMARLLESGQKFDAVFCLNDALAIGAAHALQLRGVRIPDDVAVVGFDDIEETRYTTPTLTSVHFDRADMSRAALDLLEARIEGSAGTPRLVEAQFRIEERGST